MLHLPLIQVLEVYWRFYWHQCWSPYLFQHVCCCRSGYACFCSFKPVTHIVAYFLQAQGFYFLEENILSLYTFLLNTER